MSAAERHNVTESGRPDGPAMVFAHGFGCDQNMWRFVAPAFEDRFRVILFDHAGAGGSAPDAYDSARHGSLAGYAQDVVELCRELGVTDGVFAGLVLVGPSARYINDEGYVGGFTESDIRELLDSLDSNYLGWSSVMAPTIMGNPDRPALGEELTESFCRTDPDIASRFARVTFMSDNRADLPRVTTPTLVLQCTQDAIAPIEVGQYVADM